MIAAMSEEETMIEAFKNGGDIHASTAAKVFNVPLEDQTGEAGGPPFHCDLDAMAELFAPNRWVWENTPLRSEHPLGVYELGYRLTLR